MKTANARITEKYRNHLAEIAAIFVAAGGNKSAAEREVRKLPDCGSFKQEFFARWLVNAEFGAAVKEAEDGRANSLRLRPSVRGPERIAWLLEVEKKLRERHAGLEDGETKEGVLRTAINVGKDIREEEKHFEELLQKASRREFAKFVKNLVSYIKAKHADSYSTLFPIFRDALANIEQVQSGKYTEEA